MATLDSLPDDQRAVLSLVLQRGRGYDEIARTLSIDRAAVRERARAAFDALGPQTSIPEQRRALITDYLLGQLPSPVAAETRGRLASSAGERAWARVVASELAPVARQPLPEIPSSGSAVSAEPAVPVAAPERPPAPSGGPSEPAHQPGATAPVAGVGAATAAAEAERTAEQDEVLTALGQPPPSPPETPRSSRVGGIVLLVGGALLVLAAVIVVVVLVASPGGKHKSSNLAAGSSSTAASNSSTASGTSTAATPLAAMKLVPPDSKSKAAGFAEVVKVGSNRGIEIVAQHIAPNTTKPPNAYAVWLYNSSVDAHLLGFVNPGVGKSGRLETAGGLPSNASHFKQVVITLETKADPKSPGTIVLSGPLNGLS
jgi:Sigma-70, region 4